VARLTLKLNVAKNTFGHTNNSCNSLLAETLLQKQTIWKKEKSCKTCGWTRTGIQHY